MQMHGKQVYYDYSEYHAIEQMMFWYAGIQHLNHDLLSGNSGTWSIQL